jgi:hypothetical protein
VAGWDLAPSAALQARTIPRGQDKSLTNQESKMKKLIVSMLAVGTLVVAISASHAAWVCEQTCNDFMRANGGCLADPDSTSPRQDRLQ